MIEVAVMYADAETLTVLTIEKVKLDQIHTLPGDNVLFIRIYDTALKRPEKFIDQSQGFDYYAICQMKENSKDWIMITGWDEDAFIWRQINCKGCNTRYPVTAPLSVMHKVFKGISVNDTVWKEAMAKFDAEMV